MSCRNPIAPDKPEDPHKWDNKKKNKSKTGTPPRLVELPNAVPGIDSSVDTDAGGESDSGASYASTSVDTPWVTSDETVAVPAAPGSIATSNPSTCTIDAPATCGRGELPHEASHGVQATPDMSDNRHYDPCRHCNKKMTVPAAAAVKPLGKKKLKAKARKELQSTPFLDSSAARGKLHPIAASMLMKTLYTARMARPGLLRTINRLACNISKWGMDDDVKLHRLMGHIKQSLKTRLAGWIGDDIDKLQPHLYCDADFGGCDRTQHSTTSVQLNIEGPNSRFPLNYRSQRHPDVTNSTPEAEIYAGWKGLRTILMPAMDAWDKVPPTGYQAQFHEDNQAMIRICKSGRNLTMRHLGRARRISIASLYEQLGDPEREITISPPSMKRALRWLPTYTPNTSLMPANGKTPRD